MPDITIEIISNLLNAVFSLVFITYISGGRLRGNRKAIVFGIIMFAAQTLACLIPIRTVSYIAVYLLQPIIPLIYSLSLSYKQSFPEKAIPAFAYFVSFTVSELFSSMITASYCKSTLSDAIFASGRAELIRTAVAKVILCLITAVLLLVHKKTLMIKGKAVYCLLIIFPALSLLSVLAGGLYFEFENYYISSAVTVTVSTVAIYYLIYRVWINNKAEKEKELYQKMLQTESKRYEDIKRSSEQIGKIRHDIKNMLISVKSDIDAGNISGAAEKLDSILQSVGSAGSASYSENRTVDYIVGAKLNGLQNRQIKISGSIGNMREIKDIDLSIILGNILDNAVEATEKTDNAFIDLSFFDKGNYHNILCKNTVSRSVLSDNPDLKTTKDETSAHGFGIKSVKEIVSHYGGMTEFYEDGNMFCAHIMLPIH